MTTIEHRLNIDFETASTADLRRMGAYAYSRHPDTRVLCMAWAFDDEPVAVWRQGEPFPDRVLRWVLSGGRVDAWNASFEFHIWNNVLLRQIGQSAAVPAPVLSLSQLHDTMARAANYGLPLSLDQAASAARVNVTKDKEGHALMLRMCRPRKVHRDGTTTWWHLDEPERFDRLCTYCIGDVEAERAVGRALPEMTSAERNVWLMDQRINLRGVTIDLELVRRLEALAAAASLIGHDTVRQITQGVVNGVNSTSAMLQFLQANGYPHDNLRKGTVAERLDDPACRGREREVLEVRAEVAKTSAAKLRSMQSAIDPTTPDTAVSAPVKGMLQYYGAFRTGRWAGRLIQPQNMPRGELSPTEANCAVRLIKSAPIGSERQIAELHDAIEALFGPVMPVVSSLLRGCIIPSPGHALVVSDLAQIEARVLAWLAGQHNILAAFAAGEDVYVKAASGIFGVPEAEVTKAQRQIGKVAILALGYQGGVGAFQTMAANYGVTMADEEADRIKVAWRNDNGAIVQLWWDVDAAVRRVLSGAALMVDLGPHLRFGMVGTSLVIRLPSGRALFYRDAKLITDPDGGKEEISYMGLNQYTRKWERLRTYGGKLVENITQAVARDFMAHGMAEAERAGLSVVLTVHDEILTEAPVDQADAALVKLDDAMRTIPAWGIGIPLGSDGWVGERYRK